MRHGFRFKTLHRRILCCPGGHGLLKIVSHPALGDFRSCHTLKDARKSGVYSRAWISSNSMKPKWGHARLGPTRPRGKNRIAVRLADGGRKVRLAQQNFRPGTINLDLDDVVHVTGHY